MFDGTANIMRADGLAAPFSGFEDTPITVVFAAQIVTLTSAKYFWCFGDSTDNDPLIALRTILSGSTQVLSPYIGEDGGAASAPAGATALTTNRAIYSINSDGKTVTGRINGTVDSNLNGAAWDRGIHTLDRFGVGAQIRGSAAAFLNAKFGGVLIYANQLGATQLAFAERYLSNKWSVV